MTAARGWLGQRTPSPPPPLGAWLDGVELPGAVVPEALLAGGLRELGLARAAPGRVRESAFHLLAADALITYACEASLDAEDPTVFLADILRRVAAAGS